MSKWNFGCGALDCEYKTYDIFDEDSGETIARKVSYENAAEICDAHNGETLPQRGPDHE